MKEIELFTHLETWFKDNLTDLRQNRNFWHRNKIAALIKKELQSLNHWKSRPRGNPKLALEWGEYNKSKLVNSNLVPPPKSIKNKICNSNTQINEVDVKLSLAKEGWLLEKNRLLKKYPTVNPLETKETQDFIFNWQLSKEEFNAICGLTH